MRIVPFDYTKNAEDVKVEPVLDRLATAEVLGALVDRGADVPTGPTVALVDLDDLDGLDNLDNLDNLDAPGRRVGDRRSVPRCLLGALEPGEWLGRFGGDELIVISSSARDLAGAQDLVARLGEAVRRGSHRGITIGAACATGRSSVESLLRSAAHALIARVEGGALIDEPSVVPGRAL